MKALTGSAGAGTSASIGTFDAPPSGGLPPTDEPPIVEGEPPLTAPPFGTPPRPAPSTADPPTAAPAAAFPPLGAPTVPPAPFPPVGWFEPPPLGEGEPSEPPSQAMAASAVMERAVAKSEREPSEASMRAV